MYNPTLLFLSKGNMFEGWVGCSKDAVGNVGID